MAFHSKYVCQQCGYESTGWLGKCPECGTWNSLVETVVQSTAARGDRRTGKQSSSSKSQIQRLSEIKQAVTKRTSTKISELDRVLGGGLVPGQVTLIAGEPGIGKSTLLLQLANNLDTVLYVCGEESVTQVKVRAERLGIGTTKNKKTNIELLEDTDCDSVTDQIGSSGTDFSAIIVDSIQTMTTSDLSGMAGSVGQVRECAFRLLKIAKEKNIPLFLVGHVTKEGTVAGPAVLAHIVDTVLWFEGDKTLTTRILRAVKNRFGPTDEVGVFQMEDKGLLPVADLEKAFLEKSKKQVSGSVVTSVLQGTRPLLVEIQALVVPTKLAIPRRVAQGIDSKRLELILQY
jgi:DNA repair protein RadA/Sms